MTNLIRYKHKDHSYVKKYISFLKEAHKIYRSSSLIREDRHVQIPLIDWFKKKYPHLEDYIFHIPNGGKKSLMAGAKLKAMGVLPGVSDLFLSYPNKNYYGFYIELKSPRKKPTLLQINFIERMRSVGYHGAWFCNWEEAANAIEDYLNEQK